MRISEAAGQAGVNVQTLRYYERRGLLPKPSDTKRLAEAMKRAAGGA
jgi:DNA-binding transcriptional MerR regulator